MKLPLYITLTLSLMCSEMAQAHNSADSIPPAAADTATSVAPLRWQAGVMAAAPALVTGVAVGVAQKNFRTESATFPHNHSTFAGDYMGYSPLAVAAALKLRGVESRSNWPRFITNTAMSTAIMAAMTYGIKYGVSEWRPDRDSDHSFPSCHTARAFMCAAILSREYGWRSPWYGFGGYTVASSVGLMRAMRNHHWANDVVFGAGVGILSVELGYLITDLIFRRRGLSPNFTEPSDASFSPRPSFLTVGMGVATGCGIALPAGPLFDIGITRLSAATSTWTALEGAWFFSRHFGIGGRVRLMASPLSPGSDENGTELNSATMKESDGVAAFYGAWQATSRWLLGGNIGIGVRATGKTVFSGANSPVNLILNRSTSPEGIAGMSVAYALRPNSALRINASYELARPHYTMILSNNSTPQHQASMRSTVSRFAFGASFAVMF